MRENRLRAKARIQQQAAAQNPEARISVLGKRRAGPIRLDTDRQGGPSHQNLQAGRTIIGPNGNVVTITPSTARNANQDTSIARISPGKDSKFRESSLLAAGAIEDPNAPLPRDKSLGNYIEFDLSKLHNSKGGFLVDEEVDEKESKSLQELRAERERIRERLREGMDPGINLSDEIKCRECGSRDVAEQIRAVFDILVCRACEKRYPEKYSLLTKTEVKEDYLLTDSELRDPDLLPHLLKANPHKSTYSNMMLYLRCQVEGYAFSQARWGSEAGLDAEFARREQEKARRRDTKFVKGLRDLRRKTRDNAWEKRQEERHVCQFEVIQQPDGVHAIQRCTECGFEVEVQTL
jgi:DNA-repair protein complementing XP-A cells